MTPVVKELNENQVYAKAKRDAKYGNSKYKKDEYYIIDFTSPDKTKTHCIRYLSGHVMRNYSSHTTSTEDFQLLKRLPYISPKDRALLNIVQEYIFINYHHEGETHYAVTLNNKQGTSYKVCRLNIHNDESTSFFSTSMSCYKLLNIIRTIKTKRHIHDFIIVKDRAYVDADFGRLRVVSEFNDKEVECFEFHKGAKRVIYLKKNEFVLNHFPYEELL